MRVELINGFYVEKSKGCFVVRKAEIVKSNKKGQEGKLTQRVKTYGYYKTFVDALYSFIETNRETFEVEQTLYLEEYLKRLHHADTQLQGLINSMRDSL